MSKNLITSIISICCIMLSPSPVFSFPQENAQTLYLSTATGPKTFNPILSQETTSLQVMGLIFEGLTTVDYHTGAVKPHLAESWTVSDDGLVWDIQLRHDVFWNDGEPFTADDVVFTFNDLIYNPRVPANSKEIFLIDGGKIHVSRMEQFVVRFELPQPFAPFLKALAQPIVPQHVLAEVVAHGSFSTAWGVDAAPETIVGTGPFSLDVFDVGARVVLKKNTHYWKIDTDGRRQPYLEKVIFSVMTNHDLSLVAFRNGEIDILSMQPQDYLWLKQYQDTHDFSVYQEGVSPVTFFLSLNQNPGANRFTHTSFVKEHKRLWFGEKRFRQALAYAINRDQIISLAFNGFGKKQFSPLTEVAGLYLNEDVRAYDFDQDRASALLEELGMYDRDGDGVREDVSGNPVTFSVMTNADNALRVQIAELIRYDLAHIGVDVSVVAINFNSLVSQLTVLHDWEGLLLGFSGVTDPHFGSNVWYSSGQLHVWNPQQERPATEWEARIDELFTRASRELDMEKRKVLYDEWQEIAAEELPLIYTVVPNAMYAVSGRVKNCMPTRLGGVLYNIEELYIKS